MQITYSVIISIVAYILGAINKICISKVPNKYIPIQNVIVAMVSAMICFLCKIQTDLLQAIVLCMFSTMGAGGIADLVKLIGGNENE